MKSLPLLFVLLVISTGVWAEVYQIGTGTTPSNQAPVNGNANFSWSKMICPRTDISNAGLGTTSEIIGIGFSLNNLMSDYSFTNQHIYMRHTDLSSYSNLSLDLTGAIEVYAGIVTFQDTGWQQVSFSQVFAWDGVRNIELIWTNQHGTSRTVSPQFLHSGTSASTLVYKSGSAFPTGPGTAATRLPNLQLITPMPPLPALAVYPQDGSYALPGSRLIWKSGGGCPTSYDVYFGTVDPPPLVSDGQTSAWYQPALAAGGSYFWKIVPSNLGGSPASVPLWSFRVPEEGQLAESFETWLPADWANPGGWNSYSSYPYHGSYCAYASADTYGKLLSTPRLYVSAGSSLEFQARSSSTAGNARMRIKYSGDGSNWSVLEPALSVTSTVSWQRFQVDLSSLAGQSVYLGIEAFNADASGTVGIYLDQVVGPRPAGLYPPPELSISRQGNNFSLVWTPRVGATGYRVYAAQGLDSFTETPLAVLGAGVTSYSVPAGAGKFFRVTALY